MTTLNISLTEPLRKFVDSTVSAGGYSTASEYIRSLIREDQKRRAQKELENLLLEGLGSESADFTAEDWAALREEGLKRLRVKQAT